MEISVIWSMYLFLNVIGYYNGKELKTVRSHWSFLNVTLWTHFLKMQLSHYQSVSYKLCKLDVKITLVMCLTGLEFNFFIYLLLDLRIYPPLQATLLF